MSEALSTDRMPPTAWTPHPVLLEHDFSSIFRSISNGGDGASPALAGAAG